jgi:hypothetical protein
LKWLALVLLAGCAAPKQQVRPSWWHGAWVVDGERLAQDTASLPPEARRLAADLAKAAAPEFRYEFSAGAVRHASPDGERTDAYEVVRADGRVARLKTRDVLWTLERRPRGLLLHAGERAFPLKAISK